MAGLEDAPGSCDLPVVGVGKGACSLLLLIQGCAMHGGVTGLVFSAVPGKNLTCL